MDGRWIGALLLGLVACSGGSPPPATPAQDPAAGVAPEGAEQPAQAAPPEMQPEPPSSLEEKDKKGPETADEAERALADDQRELDSLLAQPIASTTEGACRRVCSAIGSMRRSVDAICRLSDDAARCETARKTLTKNERRVSDSGCRC